MQEVASRLRNTQLEIHTRFGNPSFPKHLDMVAAHSAHTCIVLQPEGLASPQLTEAANTATAMALGITGGCPGGGEGWVRVLTTLLRAWAALLKCRRIVPGSACLACTSGSGSVFAVSWRLQGHIRPSPQGL